MRLPDVGHARARARQVVRDAVDSRALALRTAGPETATAYRDAYRWYARREARNNRIDAVVNGLRLLIIYAVLAAVVALIATRSAVFGPSIAYFLIGWAAGGNLINKLWSLIEWASPRGRILWVVSAASGTFGGVYFLVREAGSVDSLLDMIVANEWGTVLTGAAVVPLALLVVVLPAYLAVGWFLERRTVRVQPRTALLSHLFELVLMLTDPRALHDHRDGLLIKLNDAARVLDDGLWREIHLVDPASRATWRDRCRQCARHLRSFDLWVVLPRDDTREVLLAQITGLIRVVAGGALDDLPTAAARTRSRLAIVGDAVTSVLLGAIPLAGVFAVKVAGLDLSGPVGGALVVAAVAWFALTVLITFDSQATTRLSHLKNLADVMASLRGSKP